MPVEELLVHISAPGRASDDNLWRQIAASYDDFHVANTISLSAAEVTSDDPDQAAEILSAQEQFSPTQPATASGSHQDTPDMLPRLPSLTSSCEQGIQWSQSPPLAFQAAQNRSFISDSDEAAAAFESQLETSLLRRIQQSSPLRGRSAAITPRAMVFNLQEAQSTPISAYSRRFEPRSFRTSEPHSSKGKRKQTPQETSPKRQKTAPHSEVSSSLRNKSSAVPSDETTEVFNSAQPDTVETKTPQSGSNMASTDTIGSKRPRVSTSPAGLPPSSPGSMDHAASIRPSSILQSSPPAASTNNESEAADVMIEAPQPSASSKRVQERVVVPKVLATYFAHQGLEQQVLPRIKPARALEARERGFWRISMVSWPVRTKEDTWVRLQQAVRQGHAGCEVTVFREVERLGAEYGGKAGEFDLLRVYCYAEIATHVFLMLFVESIGACAKGEPVWEDCWGKAAITVERRELARR